jgi:hypothetical protein
LSRPVCYFGKKSFTAQRLHFYAGFIRHGVGWSEVVRWKLVCKIAIVLCCSHQLQAKPQDVHFQSKMPSNWLTTNPVTTESLELKLMRLILSQSSELTPHFHQVNFTKASDLTRIQSDSCMASILKIHNERLSLFSAGRFLLSKV